MDERHRDDDFGVGGGHESDHYLKIIACTIL